MVFAEFTALVQSQWLLLRDTFGAEGHDRRVQERLDKKQAKQQRKEARRAARQARKALRKQPPPIIVVEPAEPPKPRYRRSELLSGPKGLAWARAAEALNRANAHANANAFESEPNGGGRGAPQDTCSEYVDTGIEGIRVAKAVSAVVAAKTGATLQLPPDLALDLEVQLDQKQREFYDSLGGYSTVDEEEDELHEQLVGARAILETKLPAKWTVVGITTAQTKAAGFCKLPDTPEEEEEQLSSASNRRAKALSSSEGQIETEPEDDGVDIRDSDGYSTFDEEEAQDLFIADHEFNGLCAAPSSSPSAAESECEVDADVEDKEEIILDNLVEVDLNDNTVPVAPTNLDKVGENELPTVQTTFADEEVMEVANVDASDEKILNEEVAETESEVEVVGAVEETTSADFIEEEIMEIVGEVVVVEAIKEEFVPTSKDIVDQQASQPPTPQQIEATPSNRTPSIYSPGSVDEYACSIYENLRMKEHRYHVTEDIFTYQKSVTPKMRSVLVDWLVEVHQRFELEEQTLYLTVNYVDRYLAQVPVKSQRFQLIGVAALLIASKFEEIYPCDMDDLLYICERSYTKADLVDCERSLLNIFKFNLAVPSVCSFLGYYLDHFDEDELVGQLASYFSERSLLDFNFGATYDSSVVACACLLTAYCYVENQAPALVWNYRLVELTGYAVETILPCAQDLWSILSEPSDMTAIMTKYSGTEFGEVAHLPLDDLEALLC